MKKEGLILFIAVSFFLLLLSCTKPESLPEQGLTILSPKTNDVVQAGAPLEVQWKADVAQSEFGANVTIQFSKDGGSTWETVAENVPNTGKYQWSVPKVDSAKCKILIFSQYRPKYRKSSDIFTIK
ncbi:MAG TPA: Ser-Thr-rich GPI-anchored membrane family protein [Thermodesulfobacteriota bacterium]|nr:Ser-Thr-rich GPI-anchored membrane family protein [Thermodesulfobacteriota bacterium]